LLKEVWLNSLRLKENMLSSEEKIQVNFIFAGLVATLGSKEIRQFPITLSALVESEIGRAMMSTMREIASRLVVE